MNPEDENFDPEELRQLFTGAIAYPKEISFYLDESSSHRIRSLWREGIEVTTVEVQGQKGEPSDIRILAHARKLGYVLVTRDKHFKKVHGVIQEHDETSHAGIILLESEGAYNNPVVAIEFIIKLAAEADYAPDALDNKIAIL